MHNFIVDPDEPTPGEVVKLVGADGLEDGRQTKVRQILSAGDDGLYEVRDDRGQTIIVQWASDCWLEILEV